MKIKLKLVVGAIDGSNELKTNKKENQCSLFA